MSSSAGKKAGKKVGMREVAELAGVSVSAVSMALADSPQIGGDTKRRVREICRNVGYPIKRANLRRQRNGATKRFGFAVVGMNLKDEGLASLLQVMAECASERKVRLELSAIADNANPLDQMKMIKELAGELDGLLISGVYPTQYLEQLAESGIAMVMLGHLYETEELPFMLPPRICTVACDSWAMGRLATQYLLGRGHQRIGFFCERIPRGMYAWRWLMGYRAALLEAGISPCSDWSHVTGQTFTGGAPAATAFAALAEAPTAFVCPDVRTASTFIDAYREKGGHASEANMVLGGHQDVAVRYGLQQYPLIDESAEAIAPLALDLLQRIAGDEIRGFPSIIAPFKTFNIEV